MALKKETTEEVVNTPVVDESQGIEINDPMDIRPTELPLVIKLPEDASKAQIEFAKTLNGYAYKNPQKWAEKKDDKVIGGVLVKGLITRLKELKNAPDPVEGNIKVNKSSI